MLDREGARTLTRQAFGEICQHIDRQLGVHIKAHNCGKNIWRYRIDRELLEDYDREQLIGNLVANLLQSEFLREFRDLQSKIQPVIIARGNEYLRPIGTALRNNHKLLVTYRKFDEPSKEATLHPYCLKTFAGRWYLFAYKEQSEHSEVPMQCFALDRIMSLSITNETFEPETSINPLEYFRDSFGIWIDPINYPVQDITIACTPRVANYIRTLPLHHSQKETDKDAPEDNPSLTCHFTFHISLTPDFIGELNKWDKEIVIESILQ